MFPYSGRGGGERLNLKSILNKLIYKLIHYFFFWNLYGFAPYIYGPFEIYSGIDMRHNSHSFSVFFHVAI